MAVASVLSQDLSRMSLEEKLAKVKTPNLQNQLHTKIVLSSIEETLRDQKTDFTPTAYFAALLAILRESSSVPLSEANAELVTSAVYLLDLVSSYVPAPLLRIQFPQILSLLVPILVSSEATAPLIRSTIGCLEPLLVAQDSAAWSLPPSQTGPRQTIPLLLTFALDGRPKIRKRALEALGNVLKHPPQGPALDHPLADICANTALLSMEEAVSSANQVKRYKSRQDDGHDPRLMHALQLTKAIAAASRGWPTKKIEPLVETLMAISRSTNDYLVMGAFEVFEVIFECMQDEISSSKLPRLLDAITELKPAHNDSLLLPPWIAILSRGYQLASQVSPQDTFMKLPDLLETVSPYLGQPIHNIRVSAAECLISFFANCIPRHVILESSVNDDKIFEQLARQANDLLSIKFQTAWMEVFRILSALIQAMRWRGSRFLLPIVKAVGELRGRDSFQGKKEADELLGHAIRNMGPDVILSVLPHNLNEDNNKHPGRAWLLPLLREHVSNAKLAHFRSDLIPLSEQIYQRIVEHGNAAKTPRIKIYETVVHQIWATLPGYCDLPLDLQSTVDQPFAEFLSNLLYKQSDLRVELCRSLQNLVESNQAVLAEEISDEDMLYEYQITRSEAANNLVHLAGLSSNLLAVLFNVYSQTAPQSRSYILDCINAYLSITTEQDLVETFNRVSSILDTSLPKPGDTPLQKQPQPKDNIPPTSHTLLDLVIALSVYLPRSTFPSLFSLTSRILTHPTITATDPQLIKKAYKLIPRLSTSTVGAAALQARNSELQSIILSTADKAPVPARRDRLLAIHTLITYLPTEDLHFIPSVLSEIVLACKDTNKRAREAGFDLLIHVTNRIIDVERNPPGTVVRNSLVPHMPDDAPDASATLEEAFIMVSAGLAGVAPHMVAATVAALARLLFEFHRRLAKSVLEDLVGTVELFLQSNNREIVRAVLGFVKVAVVVLPEELLTEVRMAGMLKGCMLWSKENKGRMRMKVKGILERCIRRFGAGRLEAWLEGNEAGKKMVGNIRKRRDRAKRKKNADLAEDELDEGTRQGPGGKTKKREFNDEFDEAIYGSDDDSDVLIGTEEDEDADEEDLPNVSFQKAPPATVGANIKSTTSRKKHREQFIMDDRSEDEPLDLLDPTALASISSRKCVRLNGSDQRKRTAKARVNEDGKFIFGADSDRGESNDHDGDVPMAGSTDDPAGPAVNAYIEAVDGPDAVRRGQKGKLKVSSGRQKRWGGSLATGDGNHGGSGDKMGLDEQEAREVAVATKRNNRGGSQIPRRAAGVKKLPQRRGLGVGKQKMSGDGGGPLGGKVQKRGPDLGRVARGGGRGKARFRSGRGVRQQK